MKQRLLLFFLCMISMHGITHAYTGHPTTNSYFEFTSPLDVAYSTKNEECIAELLKRGESHSINTLCSRSGYGLMSLLTIFKCLEDYEYTCARFTTENKSTEKKEKNSNAKEKEIQKTNFNIFTYIKNIFQEPKKHKRLALFPVMCLFYFATNNFPKSMPLPTGLILGGPATNTTSVDSLD